MNFGEWLLFRRTQLGISVDNLAERSGVSRVAIYNIEKDESQVTLDTVWQICMGLNVSVPAMLDDIYPGAGTAMQEKLQLHHHEVPLTYEVLDNFLRIFDSSPRKGRKILARMLNFTNSHFNMSIYGKPIPCEDKDVDRLIHGYSVMSMTIEYPPQVNIRLLIEALEQEAVITYEDAGQFLKWMRIAKWLKLLDLSQKAEISSSVLSRLENGELRQVKLEDIIVLDKILHFTGEDRQSFGKVVGMFASAARLSLYQSSRGSVGKRLKSPYGDWTLPEYEVMELFITAYRWCQCGDLGGNWLEKFLPELH